MINGIDAMRMAQEVSNLPKGSFHLWFYPYNRTKGLSSTQLTEKKECTYRPQLPQQKFNVDGDNFFLFKDNEGNNKTSYRILTRYIAFPPDYRMRKIQWM